MAFTRFLNGNYDVENQLPEYIISRAKKCLEDEEKKKTELKTVDDIKRKCEKIRQCFFNAIGGLDIERTPLNPICTSVVRRSEYCIKNVIYESMPKMYVTANLYIPNNITGKAPAVLLACGHSVNGKAYAGYQKVCIDLVNNGFIVLAVDPPGQGERRQYYERTEKRHFISPGITEHTYNELQCKLTGSNVARYFVWDLIRGGDYLCSLPEVDKDRIGMTGASGGGTQTAYMMVADERIKAAVPCNYFSAREDYIMVGKAQDGEMTFYGAIADGIDMDDFISCFAPNPLMIGATQSDYFCIEGAVKAFERGKRIYKLFGFEENIKLYVAKGTHAYNDELRQAAVNWFRKALKGEEENFETDINMGYEPDETLLCTRNGQVFEHFADAKGVWDFNLEYFKKHKYKSVKDRCELKKRVEKILNMPDSKDKIYPRFISNQTIGGIEHTDIYFFSEKGITVTGTYINTEGHKRKKCTILLLENGTNDIDKEIELINKLILDSDVFVFDVRGTGAVESRAVNPRNDYKKMHNTEFKLNSDADMMKTSLMGLRVYDVIRAHDFISEFYPAKKIHMAGKGIGALYVLFAAFLTDTESVYLEDIIPSFESIVNTKYINYDSRIGIYGILKKFDLPELITDMKGDRKVEVFCSPFRI